MSVNEWADLVSCVRMGGSVYVWGGLTGRTYVDAGLTGMTAFRQLDPLNSPLATYRTSYWYRWCSGEMGPTLSAAASQLRFCGGCRWRPVVVDGMTRWWVGVVDRASGATAGQTATEEAATAAAAQATLDSLGITSDAMTMWTECLRKVRSFLPLSTAFTPCTL